MLFRTPEAQSPQPFLCALRNDLTLLHSGVNAAWSQDNLRNYHIVEVKLEGSKRAPAKTIVPAIWHP